MSETHTRKIPTLCREASEDIKYFTQSCFLENSTYDLHGISTKLCIQIRIKGSQSTLLKILTFLRPRKLGMCFPEARLQGRRVGGRREGEEVNKQMWLCQITSGSVWTNESL